MTRRRSKFRAYARSVGWWPATLSWTRQLAYLWHHRAANRWRDAQAVLGGYCNDAPWSPIPSEGGGGYVHWRCARRRDHPGVHRYRNYVWGWHGGPVEHDPIDGPSPSQPWSRYMVHTSRQSRALRRWLAAQYAARHRAQAQP